MQEVDGRRGSQPAGQIITNEEKECVCVERNTRNLGPKRGHRDHVSLHWYDTCEQERGGVRRKGRREQFPLLTASLMASVCADS